jgi:hypothetical protein
MTVPFVSRWPGAFDVGQKISNLGTGSLSHDVMVKLVNHPRVEELMPDRSPDGTVAVDYLYNNGKPGTQYDALHYLKIAQKDPYFAPMLQQTWSAGAIITAGDILDKYDYFDHGPEVELIYHLRNGVAHGNKFHFTVRGNPVGISRMNRYPAFLRSFSGREVFRITPNLEGSPVLFDFIGPDDIIQLFALAGNRLADLERGILGPNVYTSIFG